MDRIKFKLGFSNGLCVSSRGRSGGLALLWSSDTKLEIMSYSNHHIDAIITEADNGIVWRFTGFYGYPETHLREESWKLLSYLNSQFNLPWFCCGDFNEILSMSEKVGGAHHSQNQMDGFRQIVNHCGFKDLGYCGPDYTWCNMKEGSNRISLRLERAFVTNEWLGHFKDPTVHHLVNSTSDHCILAITDSPPPTCKSKHRFHFEAMWVKREDCREVIETAWHSGTLFVTPEGVASNLQRCASALASWNHNVVGNIPKKIAEKRRALNSITTVD
uniref:Endonuclease/exonuclease/phosphatase domain-containing protein n=1 Tax=Quercus lobata TaxID=97700 RepID=A0A7N2R6D1_QUELO